MNSIIRALKPWIVVLVMIMVGWLVRMNSKSPTESQLLAEIPVDLVNTISAQKGGRTLLFERKGDAWMQTQPYSQPADPAAIHALLVAMAEARVIQASPLEKIPSRAGWNGNMLVQVIPRAWRGSRIWTPNLQVQAQSNYIGFWWRVIQFNFAAPNCSIDPARQATE